MQTYPDFTWEWIIQMCEDLQMMMLESIPSDMFIEGQKNYFKKSDSTIALVNQLQKHPNLGLLVPMLSNFVLRWFPNNKLEVNLCFRNDVYILSVETRKVISKVIQERIVTLDTAADEVYALITQLRDD